MNIRQHRLTGIIAIALIAMLTGLRLPHQAAAQVIPPNPRVEQKLLDELQANGSADFVIELGEQADLSAAYAISDWNERGQFVVNTLKATADRSQKGVKGQLERQGAIYTAYFASNVVVVRGGSQRALEAIVNLPEVARVRAPIVVPLEPVEDLLARAVDLTIPMELMTTANPTWGLVDTEALRFWSTYKRQGQGIVVANIDSGVQYNHPALATSYKCNSGDPGDPKCWKDVTNLCPNSPCDNLGHGTHTMGTMVGSNLLPAGPSVGMSPQANWIACKAFATNNALDPELLACAQWALAPGGDPANRPHVVNNSWGDPASGDWFSSSVDAWRAAGIFPIFSAGNLVSKTGCVKMGSPADYFESFTVGAHDIDGVIADFSLNGSNGIDTTLFTKPNLTAPGVSIYSSVPTNGYIYLSGTSMSAPHVSGAVALLWSCNPALIGEVDQTFQLLQGSADAPPDGSCGAPAEGSGNYTYGYGYLDVYQAGLGMCLDWKSIYLPMIKR